MKPHLVPFTIQGDTADQQHTKSPEDESVHDTGAAFPGPPDQPFLAHGQNQHGHHALFNVIGSIGRLQGAQQLDFTPHRTAEYGQGYDQQDGHQQGIHGYLINQF